MYPNVLSEATEVDTNPLGARTPLVLIHGINPDGIGASPNYDTWHNFLIYLAAENAANNHTGLLASFKPYKFEYSSNRSGYTVKKLGEVLRDLIEVMPTCDSEFQDKPLVIIAHSMGGLVARSYMEEWGGGNRVLRLITLGTPHHGSPVTNGNAFRDHVPDWLVGQLSKLRWWNFGVGVNSPNRSDLHWDNYNAAVPGAVSLNYAKYSDEENHWLEALNANRQFNSKIFAYAGYYLSCPAGVPLCASAAILLNSDFKFFSDGVVPTCSAWFCDEGGNTTMAGEVREFKDYNHEELHDGKEGLGPNDTNLFGQIRKDLTFRIQGPPPQLTQVSPAKVVGSNALQWFTLTGSRFTSSSRVRITWAGGQTEFPVGGIIVDSATQIRFGVVTGSTADRWSVRVVNFDNQSSTPVTFDVSAPVVVNTYALSTNAANGTVTRSPDATRYAANAQVTLTAVPKVGYKFLGWSGDATGATSPVTVAMTKDRSIAAVFVPLLATGPAISSVTVGATAGCLGVSTAQWVTIVGSGFANSASVLLTANGWTGRVNLSRTDYAGVPTSIRVCSDLTPATQWTAQVANPGEIYSNPLSFSTAGLSQFTVTTSASPSNRGEVSAGVSAVEGTNVIVVAETYTGSRFVNWTEGGSYVSGERVYSFALHANRSLVANFEAAIAEPSTGSIGVNIVPAGALSAGAGWRLAGETFWRDSGKRALNQPFGSYTIEFKPLAAWLAPTNQVVVISASSTDPTVTSGDYVHPQINAPSNLTAIVTSDGKIQVNWQDNATNEAFYFLEFKPQGRESFSPRSTLGPNATSYVFDQPYSIGTICFRARATDSTATVFSEFSNEACAAPRPLPIDPACYAPTGGAGLSASTKKIAAGPSGVIAIGAEGSVWRWGSDVVSDDTLLPLQIGGLTDVTAVAMTGGFALARRSDGSVWAWGENTAGQLGDGTLANRAAPSRVLSLPTVSAVAAGGFHGVALATDGTVWTWGSNSNGQLGDGTRTDSTIPHQVAGLTGIVKVAAGNASSFAVRSDGVLLAWGANSGGLLGVGGGQLYQLTPATVAGLSSVTNVSAIDYYALAVLNDGTLWAWGSNASGRIGDGSASGSRTTPFQVSGLQNVVAATAGYNFSLAVTSDGAVWAWGSSSGGIGDGSTDEPRYLPVRVVWLADAVAVTSTRGAGVALRENGTICTWGDGSGLGNGVNRLGRPVAGHVVGPDGVGALDLVDETPDQFAFAPRSVTVPNAPVISNSISVNGLESSAMVSISGGEYSINGSAFIGTGTDGQVRPGDSVAVRVYAPSAEGQSSATLTIGGISASFAVTLIGTGFTDEPIVTGITLLKAVHITELRTRIDALRVRFQLAGYSWTDPSLGPGTSIRAVHLTDLRIALQQAYVASGRTQPSFTDSSVTAGSLGIGARHIQELRDLVIALEGG